MSNGKNKLVNETKMMIKIALKLTEIAIFQKKSANLQEQFFF